MILQGAPPAQPDPNHQVRIRVCVCVYVGHLCLCVAAYGVTAGDTVEKKQSRGAGSEAAGYLKGKENGLNIRNKMVYDDKHGLLSVLYLYL